MLLSEKERQYQKLLKDLGVKVGKEILELEGKKKAQVKRIARLQSRAFREVNRPA